ncbi:hypothetical protein SB57_08005 [Lactobacillus delbrueckii subsp. bulgaricus]|nr:hypothetical protein SB57_08005 [Lactobacillus delbrueckii subsp. bulgaricus]
MPIFAGESLPVLFDKHHDQASKTQQQIENRNHKKYQRRFKHLSDQHPFNQEQTPACQKNHCQFPPAESHRQLLKTAQQHPAAD